MNSTVPRITAEWLRQKPKVCANDVRKFKELYPDGAPCTLTNLRKAEKADFNVWWLENKLSGPRRAAYWKAEGEAWQAYWKETTPERQAYEKIKTRAAWLAFNKAIAPAWQSFLKAKAPVLVAALRQELKSKET